MATQSAASSQAQRFAKFTGRRETISRRLRQRLFDCPFDGFRSIRSDCAERGYRIRRMSRQNGSRRRSAEGRLSGKHLVEHAP